jgi:RNA polymerase sigma-70 factor (ECF subfamily)
MLAAQNGSSEADLALAEICERYWYPLYAYVLRSGYSRDDAKDLTQEFFHRLLAKQWLATADPARGRFRSFLLAALKHFLANEWRRGQARHRGGDLQFLSFDDADAAQRFERESGLSPDALYEREWARGVLSNALAALRRETESVRFAILEPALTGEGTDGYSMLAGQLGLTVNGVKAAVHRLRQRYGELLRAEVSDTLNTRADTEDELRYLQSVLSKSG